MSAAAITSSRGMRHATPTDYNRELKPRPESSADFFAKRQAPSVSFAIHPLAYPDLGVWPQNEVWRYFELAAPLIPPVHLQVMSRFRQNSTYTHLHSYRAQLTLVYYCRNFRYVHLEVAVRVGLQTTPDTVSKTLRSPSERR